MAQKRERRMRAEEAKPGKVGKDGRRSAAAVWFLRDGSHGWGWVLPFCAHVLGGAEGAEEKEKPPMPSPLSLSTLDADVWGL